MTNLSAGKVPQATVPIGSFTGPDGQPVDVTINPLFWRFLARVAGQFNGSDPSIAPSDITAIAALTEASRAGATAPDAFPVFGRPTPAGDSIPFSRGVSPLPGDGLPALPARAVPAGFIFDTRANRANYPAAAYPDGTEYRESDTTHLSVVYVAEGSNWVYYSGQISDVQANIIAGLGTHDAGLRYFITDYAHQIQWSGAAWQRGPEDPEEADGLYARCSAPAGSGWHALDGSTVAFIQYANPTVLGSRTLPNSAATAAYVKLGAAYNPALNAPASPTISGQTESGNANINGSVAATDLSPIVTTAQAGATQTVIAGFINPHSHGKGTLADSGHQHNLTSADAPIALPGDPIEWFEAIGYYRQ